MNASAFALAGAVTCGILSIVLLVLAYRSERGRISVRGLGWMDLVVLSVCSLVAGAPMLAFSIIH